MTKSQNLSLCRRQPSNNTDTLENLVWVKSTVLCIKKYLYYGVCTYHFHVPLVDKSLFPWNVSFPYMYMGMKTLNFFLCNPTPCQVQSGPKFQFCVSGLCWIFFLCVFFFPVFVFAKAVGYYNRSEHCIGRKLLWICIW